MARLGRLASNVCWETEHKQGRGKKSGGIADGERPDRGHTEDERPASDDKDEDKVGKVNTKYPVKDPVLTDAEKQAEIIAQLTRRARRSSVGMRPRTGDVREPHWNAVTHTGR